MKIRKPVYAFLILIPMIILFAAAIAVVTILDVSNRDEERIQLKIDGVSRTLDSVEKDFAEVVIASDKKIRSVMEMMRLLLQNQVKNGQYRGTRIFDDDFVVRVANGSVIYPDGVDEIPGLSAELIESECFMEILFFEDANEIIQIYLVSSVRIAGNDYYIDLIPYSDYSNSISNTIRIEETISEIEKAYECVLIIVSNPEAKGIKAYGPEEPIDFFLLPDGIEDDDITPEDLGITKDFLRQKPASFGFNGKEYRSSFKRINFYGEPYMVIVLSKMDRETLLMLTSTILFTSITFAVAVSVILWLYWVQAYVRDNELLPAQAASYKPKEIRKRVYAVLLIGCIAVMILAVFYRFLSNLNLEAISNQNAQETVMSRLEDDEKNVSAAQQDEEKWIVYYIERLAVIFSENPEVCTREYLEQVNQLIGSEYLMVFDENGQETASSNGLIGYSLPETERLKIFTDLLKGVKTIFGEIEQDPDSLKNVKLVGSSVPQGVDGPYGALIAAVDVEESWQNDEQRRIREFLENATPVGNLCIVIDKENNTVAYSSEPSFLGESVNGLEYKEGMPDDIELDTFSVNNMRYYGSYDSDEKYIVYYLTSSDLVQKNSLLFAIVAAIGFLVVVGLVSLFMLAPYTKAHFKESVRIKEVTRHAEMIDMDSLDDFFDRSDLDDDDGLSLKERWKALIPEQKTHLFLRIFLGIVVLFLLLTLTEANFIGDFRGRSTTNFILLGNWKRGLNLLGFAGSMIVVLSFVIFIFFKDILFQVLCSVLDSKAETICRLVFSLLQYTAVLGMIYLIMGYLGFNTTFQLTSVGVIALAISMGSKDIVADILAGIFIIFEGDFHVGDFVDINGFTGIVQEIGVRSTKVLGLGDNLKIISNQNVKNVLNMSKMNTWLTLEFKIPSNVPLLEVEELFEKEFPSIPERIPNIISGPYYKGVWGVDFGNKVLHVSCECLEQYSRVVRRKLNHEIIVLLESNGHHLA